MMWSTPLQIKRLVVCFPLCFSYGVKFYYLSNRASFEFFCASYHVVTYFRVSIFGDVLDQTAIWPTQSDSVSILIFFDVPPSFGVVVGFYLRDLQAFFSLFPFYFDKLFLLCWSTPTILHVLFTVLLFIFYRFHWCSFHSSPKPELFWLGFLISISQGFIWLDPAFLKRKSSVQVFYLGWIQHQAFLSFLP